VTIRLASFSSLWQMCRFLTVVAFNGIGNSVIHSNSVYCI